MRVSPLQIIVLAVLALAAAFLIKPTLREEIKFAATLFGGTAAIYSAYYVGVGLRLKIEREKQQASFDLLDMLNKPEFVAVRSLLDKEVGDHRKISEDALYEKIMASRDLDAAVTTVLGILEDTAIAIQNDFVDEDILYASMSEIVKKNQTGLRGYIVKLRESSGVPLYFVELDKLAKAWREGKRLSDGKDFPPGY